MVCAAYHNPVPAAFAGAVVVIMAVVAGGGAGDAFVVVAGGSVGMVVIVVGIVVVISGLVCLFLAMVSRMVRFALLFAFAKVAMVVANVAHSGLY